MQARSIPVGGTAPLARPLCVALLLVASGCSHTFYQFHMGRAEASHVEAAQQALAASQRNPSAMVQVVDLDGRRAIETLLAAMTVEETGGDPQFQRLSRAMFIGVMGDDVDPVDAFDQELSWIAARVGQRVAASGLRSMGLGIVADMIGEATDSDGMRIGEMQQSLARGHVETCRDVAPIISYDAGILGHIRPQLAEQDPTYVEWRARVRAIHLVLFGCRNHYGLFVMARNANESGVRVIGWHFLTPDQWARTEPRLRAALDLPAR